MEFIIALVALAAAFAVWHFLYESPDFTAYLTTLSAQYGPKWKVVFWVSVGFSIWGLLTFHAAPGVVSLLISVIFLVLWLSSPAGQKWLKSITG